MYRFLLATLLVLTSLTAQAAAEKNHFGFLGADLTKGNFTYLTAVGAGWMRPHPGPAVWEMMQSEDGGAYDWTRMDTVVTRAQNNNIKLLVTIWPFAAWDQVRHDNFERCEVSDNDIFLPNKEGEDKGQQDYLPAFRCNPYDWEEYEAWVEALVERYDGDGKQDMENLTLPVRYWEVMNEPDLPGSDELDFYQDGMDEYYTLLKRTFKAIRRSDKTAEVLIAGAAGSSTDQEGEFLDFYSNLFTAHPKTKQYFTVGNIHHISPEGDGDFNVGAYKNLLEDFGITKKPIWVTEAGAEGVTDTDTQKSLIRSNTKEAIASGAAKIFFIHYSFGDSFSDLAQSRAKKVYKKLIARWNTQ